MSDTETSVAAENFGDIYSDSAMRLNATPAMRCIHCKILLEQDGDCLMHPTRIGFWKRRSKCLCAGHVSRYPVGLMKVILLEPLGHLL